MPFAPYQWRADQGYLPPSDSVPVPVIPMAMPQLAPMYSPQIAYGPAYGRPTCYYPHLGQPVLAAAAAAAAPPSPPPSPPAPSSRISRSTAVQPKDSSSNAPSQPKDASNATSQPNDASSNAPSQPKDSSSNAPSQPKDSASKAPSHSSSAVASVKSTGAKSTPSARASTPRPPASACPSLRPGVNYMFPPKTEHTMLHIFSKAAPIWEEKYHGRNLNFKMFKVSTHFAVKKVIERVLQKEGGDGPGAECDPWAVTEVVEAGSGCWRKGTTIPYAHDMAQGSLESVGWNRKRGRELPPVWLVVHRV